VPVVTVREYCLRMLRVDGPGSPYTRPMTNWGSVAETDYAVPTEVPLESLVAELTEMLKSPDPRQRDELAYSTLATWIDRELLPADALDELGDEMATRFTSPQIQVRTFAPLILDCLVTKGRFKRSWYDGFAAWYPSEKDLRGHDEELGWLHAIAHGSDLLAAFGRCPQMAPPEVLAVAADRLVAPADQVWRDHEHDRLGFAIALTLAREDLGPDQAISWLAPVEANWEGRVQGPPSGELSNAVHTLRMVYLLTETGVRPSGVKEPIRIVHGELVRKRLLEMLHGISPYMW
jgi:hypothetical protein